MKDYDHKKIEKKWQKEWQKNKLYKTKTTANKPKCYVLDMFPYPSGEGLHVGHPKGYIATDIYSRYKQMTGHNVLHPMGWDAFGLPAENYAIKNKVHPRKAVEKNVARYKEQLEMIGFNYDWAREINTTDPEYYKWTQWIFLELFKKGLAYESYEPINWCPSCKTGLANEDLEAGRCERCGSEVEKKPMRQWVLRITDYAERLLEDLDKVNWPESIKELQRNWIGRSEGAEIKFKIQKTNGKNANKNPKVDEIKIFTTRPDTICGATFMAVSPELANGWLENGWEPETEVVDYVKKVLKDRLQNSFKEVSEKTGIFTGFYAENPASKEKIPVWITNYVLGDVGTGAIMAVPAHDERDFEFARKYDLPIRQVVMPSLIDQSNPPQEGKRDTFRNLVLAVVFNPKTNKYLTLNWKKEGWVSFITGGVDENEDRVEAAKREIMEETGYTKLELIRSFGMTEAFFFAKHKDVNRKTHAEHLFFRLIDETKIPIGSEELDQHESQWRTLGELQQIHLQHAENQILLNRIQTGNDSFTGAGVLMNSGKFDGLTTDEAKKKITEFVGGKLVTNYKLKDWVFSRQRYWGEPIPLIHCEKCGVVPVLEKDLPVKLPEVKSYEPTGTGESPLAGIDKWVNVKCPTCDGKGKRETNTMPQWAGSCWYYLRFIDPKNKKTFVDKKKENYWMKDGIDMYVGGAEHATRHLIYARFWHKFLYDIDAVSETEPFRELKSVGLILGEDGRKMSKRWGNVVNPDEVVALYGADTLRVYEMFMGPFSAEIPWATQNMIGSRRFIEKVWRLSEKVDKKTKNNSEIETLLHQTIKKVGEDIKEFSFNTAISSLMILVNKMEDHDKIATSDFVVILKLLAPFAPHMTEELWSTLGQKKSIHLQSWPEFNPIKIVNKKVKIAVQVNGKVRSVLGFTSGVKQKEVEEMAKADPNVSKHLKGREVKKVIFVIDKIINFIVV